MSPTAQSRNVTPKHNISAANPGGDVMDRSLGWLRGPPVERVFERNTVPFSRGAPVDGGRSFRIACVASRQAWVLADRPVLRKSSRAMLTST